MMQACQDRVQAEVIMNQAWDEETQARVEMVPTLPSPTLIRTCITGNMLTHMKDSEIAINYLHTVVNN